MTASAPLERSQGPGHGGPARGYSWPPFQPGHRLSVKHGAYSALEREPVARLIVERTLEEASVRYLRDPSYTAGVWSWANAEAALLLVQEWVDQHGLFDAEGEPRSAVRALNDARRLALRERESLGLTPASRARILRDLRAGAGESAEGDNLADYLDAAYPEDGHDA